MNRELTDDELETVVAGGMFAVPLLTLLFYVIPLLFRNNPKR